MAKDIATLIERNLQEVFSEGDDIRRRAVADEIYADDIVFAEPHGVYRGRDEVVRIAGIIRAKHPSFRYQVIAPVEAMPGETPEAEIARARWTSGAPRGSSLRRYRRGAGQGRQDHRHLHVLRRPSRPDELRGVTRRVRDTTLTNLSS